MTLYCPRCQKHFDLEDWPLMCSACGFQLLAYAVRTRLKMKRIVKRAVPFAVVLLVIFTLFITGRHFLNKSLIGTVTSDGAVIFFDKLHYSNGFRYLAVAPKDIKETLWVDSFPKKLESAPKINKTYGGGARTSYEIFSILGEKSAAGKVILNDAKSDYYLGNKKEMEALKIVSNTKFFKKCIASLEGFDPLDKTYWTSQMLDKDAYALNMAGSGHKAVLLPIVDKVIKDTNKADDNDAPEDDDSGDSDDKIITTIAAAKCFLRPIRKF